MSETRLSATEVAMIIEPIVAMKNDYEKEIERLNNKIEELEKENAVLKTLVINKDRYSYGIR